MIDKNNKKIIKDIKFNQFRKYNIKWVFVITLWTLVLTIFISFISESIMKNLDMVIAFITLLFIIILGVVFDIIGIAVTASDEGPFHSMAAKKIKEGSYAVKLVRNAGPVSNFCNDVIGDISGIISGATGTIIVLKLVDIYGIKNGSILSIIMSSLIASLTVGGKALGKEIAINNSEKIVFCTAKFLMFLNYKIGINILPNLKKKKKGR